MTLRKVNEWMRRMVLRTPQQSREVKTPCSQCKGHEFDLIRKLRSYMLPYVAKKKGHMFLVLPELAFS